MTDSTQKLRAWWWHRQGLDGALHGASPDKVLEHSGWTRSLGGANTYLSLFARAGVDRAQVDDALATQRIHELPSVRGCTYVVPARDFGLALQVGRGASRGELRQANKLGFSTEEIEQLCQSVIKELEITDEPLDPAQLLKRLGEKVQSFGVAGERAGLSTPMPVALGLLEERGAIRRVPLEGRLDSARLRYTVWENPPTNVDSDEQARVQLVRRYLTWTGPAALEHLRWFTGFGSRALQSALTTLEAEQVEPELWLLPEQRGEFDAYTAPEEPHYALISWIDALALLRRDISSIIEPEDLSIVLPDGKSVRDLRDFPHHLIVDRGHVVGFWEFDPEAEKIVWGAFTKVSDSKLHEEVARTEQFIMDQLGDVRGNALDTVAARAPRLEAMRELARGR